MEVLDIVQSAAFKSGIIPSFNPDEMPGDILNAGVKTLADEILPQLNCDRTIDITETSRVYTPENGRIVLTPLRQPRENFVLVGWSAMTSGELVDGSWDSEVFRLRPGWKDEWPTNEFDEPTTCGIWSADGKLVVGDAPDKCETLPDVNIDFPPMRIDAVLEESSRIPYEYVYREEFERILKVTLPGVYTCEEHSDKLVILLNGTNQPKRVVMPVPLQIVDSDHQRPGRITAPPKFRKYLIDSVAVSLAITYGVSTVDLMRQQAAQSYNMLKKNKTQPLHPMNSSEQIAEKLRRDVRGRRFYEHI